MEKKTYTVNDPEFWSSHYQDENHPWDLGGSNPVFSGLLAKEQFPIMPSESYAPSLMIPGCGLGHDAIHFAKKGFAVTAIDFAKEPIEQLKARAEEEGVSVDARVLDVFSLPETLKDTQDIILEYTCFCAIDPSRRDEYVGVLSSTLRKGGHLLALVFPIWDRKEGPPYAVCPDQWEETAKRHGLQVKQRGPSEDSHPARAAHETLIIFQKQ